MGLPKIEQVTFRTELPSTKQKIAFRSFLVKEEKILLVALQSGERDAIIDALRQIITNCVIEPEDFDVDKITLFDLEFLFVQLRIKSIGDKVQLKFAARKKEFTECKECLNPKGREVEIDLNDAKIDFSDVKDKKIEINGKVGLMMKYPTFSMLKKIEQARTEDDINSLFEIFWECIDFIYEGDKNIDPKEFTVEEGKEFIETIPAKAFQQIQEFLASVPKLKQTVHFKCKNKDCDFERTHTLEGLEDFFA